MAARLAGRYVYGVSELVDLLARELEAAFPDVWVEGEVASLKTAASGHVYFVLKGDRSSLSVALFRNHALRLPFRLESGLQVLVRGKISLYRVSGDLQLYATLVEPAGLGAMQIELEQAKRRLMEEGLTDAGRKRPIPPFPHRIGIVTSIEGAALQDVLTVLRRRRAGFDVVIAPSLVQGEKAPGDLLRSLLRLTKVEGMEAILLTRGGGSITDLWAFNDEALAREVALSPIPVISAVGHEVDTVLTDLTADLRAPTPSAAAEILTARHEVSREASQRIAADLRRGITDRFQQCWERLDRGSPVRQASLLGLRVRSRLESARHLHRSLERSVRDRNVEISRRLERCAGAVSPDSILHWIESAEQRNGILFDRMKNHTREKLRTGNGRVAEAARVLLSLRPSSVLARGYAAVFDDSGNLVTEPGQAPPGASLSVALKRGGIRCRSEEGEAEGIPPVIREEGR